MGWLRPPRSAGPGFFADFPWGNARAADRCQYVAMVDGDSQTREPGPARASFSTLRRLT